MDTLKGLFSILILIALISQPIRAQTANNNTKRVTAENLKALIPVNIKDWQRSSFKYRPRGFYEEPQGARVRYSNKEASYYIQVDFVYGFSEQIYKQLSTQKKEMNQGLNSDKFKQVKKGNRTIYGRAQADLKDDQGLKFSVAKVNIDGTAFYLIRRKDDESVYEIKGSPTFNFINEMAFAIRTCERSDGSCRVENVKKATDAIVSIIKSLDFNKLASLQPTPYVPPEIEVPEGFQTKYFKTTNTIVGFAYPEKWVIKNPSDARKHLFKYLIITCKDFTSQGNLLFKSISNAMRNKEFQWRLFKPGNVLIWIDGIGDRGDRWDPQAIKINMEWMNHKLNNAKIIQSVNEAEKVGYPGAFFIVGGKGAEGHPVIYKEVQFQEPSGRVFKVSVLRPAKASSKIQGNIQALLQSIIAHHSE